MLARAIRRSLGEEMVPLRIAASLVYSQMNRRLGGSGDGSTADFESTALALSHLADVWFADGSGTVAKVPRADLAVAEFLDGGESCRTPAGVRYLSLKVRYADLMDAIVILKGVRGIRGT